MRARVTRASRLRAEPNDPMTLSDFRHWSRTAACIFANDGPVAHITRDHAAKIRPFDLALSDLYLRAAEANEAIRAHLAEYQAAGSPGPSPATRCEPEESGDT